MCFDYSTRYQYVKHGNMQEAQHAYFSFTHFHKALFRFDKSNLPQYLWGKLSTLISQFSEFANCLCTRHTSEAT